MGSGSVQPKQKAVATPPPVVQRTAAKGKKPIVTPTSTSAKGPNSVISQFLTSAQKSLNAKTVTTMETIEGTGRRRTLIHIKDKATGNEIITTEYIEVPNKHSKGEMGELCLKNKKAFTELHKYDRNNRETEDLTAFYNNKTGKLDRIYDMIDNPNPYYEIIYRFNPDGKTISSTLKCAADNNEIDLYNQAGKLKTKILEHNGTSKTTCYNTDGTVNKLKTLFYNVFRVETYNDNYNKITDTSSID